MAHIEVAGVLRKNGDDVHRARADGTQLTVKLVKARGRRMYPRGARACIYAADGGGISTSGQRRMARQQTSVHQHAEQREHFYPIQPVQPSQRHRLSSSGRTKHGRESRHNRQS